MEPNRRPNTTCDVCGKAIYRRPNILIKNKTKTCSHSCNRVLHKEELQERGKRLLNKVMYGEENPAWKGGVTLFKKKGNYKNVRYVRCPKEYLGMARKDGYVMEHRLFMAQRIGRILDRTECVHHINHDPTNNEINNLLLFPCNRSHKIYEGIENGKNTDKLQGTANRT
jgi:predicted nucleic acid-binding Zn ribbon protein